MLSKEQNDLLTRVGPGTPGGEMLRRYWTPAALSVEVPRHGRGAPLPVRLLGEDLVLFWAGARGQGPTGNGQKPPTPDPQPPTPTLGLLGIHCSHRGADLSYGRLEDGGLRCIYHGWLYDVHGSCLEQPGEPVVRQAHHERSNVAAHPEPVEGPFHQRIKQRAYPCHEIAGVIFAYLGPGEPSPTGDGYLMNWHVPIDDTHHWRYSMAFKRSGPIGPQYARARQSVTDENYRFPRNKANRYLQDREEQKTDTFAGLGPIFVVGDAFATETAGEIQDRTQEHLAATDAGIVATRLMMLRAIKDVQEGRDPPNVIRHPDQQDRPLEITVTTDRQ